MGTIGIVRLLIRNWAKHNPIYTNEERHVATLSTRQVIRHVIQRIWKPVGVLLLVALAIGMAQFLCGTQGQSLNLALDCTQGGIGLLLLGILLIAYLWPAFIAVSASRVIAVEREHQTWDILLTTPVEWRDVVMAKLAAALHGFNEYGGAFLYLQSFLIAVIFALVLGQNQSWIGLNGTAPTAPVAILIIASAVAEFVIGRAQDYVMAGLIGLLASLLTPTRQAAASVALMGALAMILLRALVTALFIAMLPGTAISTLLLLLSVGPASAVVFALSLPLAIMVLLALIVAREGAIRLMYRWLLAHLAEGRALDNASVA